jgi:starch-binding outer membrane protein, SusD/RagB family
MKKIAKLLFAFLLIVAASCADFLEEPLQGTYSNATFYKTEAHARFAIAGVYNAISFVSTDNNLWVFGDIASDDAAKGGLAGDQSDIQFIDEFTYARNNASIEKFWKRYYEGISRANYLLYYGPAIEMDVVVKKRILAEAKFIRAYLYFTLVNVYGSIPIKLNPPINQEEINKPKSSVPDVYAQIEKDLTEAVVDLEKISANLGRVTQGAAWGLLAKGYLYQEKYQQTLTAIEAVDALGVYNLQKVYKNNFIDSTQNNSESLFEIQHLSLQDPKLGSHLNQYFSPAKDNGYFFNVPLQNFINEFEKTPGNVVDPRLDYTVGRNGQKWINGEDFNPPSPGSPPWSPTGYLQKKHCQPTREVAVRNSGDAGLNYVYLRYADILLMKAEALNGLNRSSEALLPLNAVRKRARESYLFDKTQIGFGVIPAGLLPDVVNFSPQAVTDAIRHERRVELGFEFHRFFDLMRYGKAPAEAALAGSGFNYEKHRYFPIPQSELDSNPLIKE